MKGARAAESVRPLRRGEERAVAATKSSPANLTALLPVLAALSGTDAVADLPDPLDATLALADPARALAQCSRFATRLLLLPRGQKLGAAQEAALKLKETSGIQVEAYSAAEFSHGPRRLLTEGVPLLGLSNVATTATGPSPTDVVPGPPRSTCSPPTCRCTVAWTRMPHRCSAR